MMQNATPETLNPLDPAHFAIATHVASSLQIRAKMFLDPPQPQPDLTMVRQDTQLVDRFGNAIRQAPREDEAIDVEFREVGRGQ